MKIYNIKFVFQDRKVGPLHNYMRQEASSLPVALGKATRRFMNDRTRKERFDINQAGLKVEVISVGKVETYDRQRNQRRD